MPKVHETSVVRRWKSSRLLSTWVSAALRHVTPSLPSWTPNVKPFKRANCRTIGRFVFIFPLPVAFAWFLDPLRSTPQKRLSLSLPATWWGPCQQVRGRDHWKVAKGHWSARDRWPCWCHHHARLLSGRLTYKSFRFTWPIPKSGFYDFFLLGLERFLVRLASFGRSGRAGAIHGPTALSGRFLVRTFVKRVIPETPVFVIWHSFCSPRFSSIRPCEAFSSLRHD